MLLQDGKNGTVNMTLVNILHRILDRKKGWLSQWKRVQHGTFNRTLLKHKIYCWISREGVIMVQDDV